MKHLAGDVIPCHTYDIRTWMHLIVEHVRQSIRRRYVLTNEWCGSALATQGGSGHWQLEWKHEWNNGLLRDDIWVCNERFCAFRFSLSPLHVHGRRTYVERSKCCECEWWKVCRNSRPCLACREGRSNGTGTSASKLLNLPHQGNLWITLSKTHDEFVGTRFRSAFWSSRLLQRGLPCWEFCHSDGSHQWLRLRTSAPLVPSILLK